MRYSPRAALVVAFFLSLAPAVPAAPRCFEDPTPQELALRERYEKALLANPTRGTAFERLYQSYVDVEGSEAWTARLKKLESEEPTNAAHPLILGFLEERLGHEAEALAAFGRAIERDATSARAHAARGYLHWHMRKFEPAAADLRKAIELNPPREELQDLLKTLGRVFTAAGDMDAAKRTWLELVERYPDDAMVVEELAELLADEGQTDDAIAQFEKLRAIGEDDYLKLKAAQQIAEMKIQQQKFEEATALYSDLLDNLAPGSWLRNEARQMLEEAYRRKGENEEIVRFYTKWIETHPDDVEMQVALGDAFRGLQQNEKAEETYRKVIERAPSRADAREALAETLLDQGKQTEATEQYRIIAEASPGEAEVWERLGSVIFDDAARPEAERRADAIAAWRNILGQRPTDATRAIRAAEILRSRQCEAEALEHYRKAIELTPEDLAQYEYLGDYLHQLGRKDEALAAWRMIVDGTRGTVENWKRLAETLASVGLRAEALGAVESGLKLVQRPEEGFSLVAIRARVLVDEEKLDDARAAIDDLAGRCETPVQQREVMGRRIELYRRAGRLNEEIERLAAALKQGSDRPAASVALDYELLGRMMQAASRAADAIKAVEQANALDGASPERLALAVELYRGAGNRLAAIDALRKLIAADPREESAHLEMIIELSRQQGQEADAIKAAERLIDLSPETDRGYLLASDLQWSAGQSEAALTTLRRGIRKAPKEITLQLALARRLMDLNRLQLALDQFWRAFQAADDDSKRLTVASEMARVYFATGQFDRLVDRLIEWRRDPEVEAVAALALSAAYKEANRPERAEQELERALSRRPNDTNTLEQLIEMAEQSGRTEQAIQYAERLVTQRPTDAKLLSRLGGLLFQAGRASEAVAKWRASMQVVGGDDPAGRALELAETLLRYGLGSEAQQTLIDASTRFPDDWRVKFRLAMQLKQERQYPRAARLLDELLAMAEPAEDPRAKAGKGARKQPAPYAGLADPSLSSPLIEEWTNLQSVIQQTSSDFEAQSRSNYRYYSRYAYRYYGYGGYYGGRSSLNYMPDGFRAAQTAALVQRLHLSELEGKLSEALAALGRRAGLGVTADDLAAAAKLALIPAEQRDADTPSAPPVNVTSPGADEAARLEFLRALIAVDLHDLCWNAASALFAAAPNDKSVAALLAVYATAARADEGGRYAAMAMFRSGYYGGSFYAPYGMPRFNYSAGGFQRPRALDRATFDVEPILSAFSTSDPQAALLLASRLASELIGLEQREEGLRWVRWVLGREPNVEIRLSMVRLLLTAEQPDEAIALLPGLRREVRQEVQKSTTAGANPGWGSYSQRQMRRAQYGAQFNEMAEELFRQGEQSEALNLVWDWLDLTAVEGRTGLSAGSMYASSFSLDPSEVVKFPSVNPLFDEERLGGLRAWVDRAKTAGLESEFGFRLVNRLAASDSESRADAAMTLAIVEGFEERFDEAARRLQEAVAATDDDRLRLALAQVLVQLEKTEEALEPLSAIRLRVGPIFKDAQIGLLKIATKLNRQELGRKAAQQLLGMRLEDEERFALVPYMKKLELEQQATAFSMPGRQRGRGMWQPPRGGSSRFRNMGALAGRQMETLTRLAGDAANRDAVVALARRILADKTRELDLNAQDQELRGAIRAIKQVGALDDEIKRLEGDLKANPKSTDALLHLYLIHTYENQRETAQGYIDRAFDLLPGNMRLRYQHALMLAGTGNAGEAVRQLERVLREAPWVIDEGSALANAFREASRLGDLVDLVTRIEPTAQVSLERRDRSLDWLGQIAGTIQEDQPELAQRLWRRQRELSTSAAMSTQLTLGLIDEFVKRRKIDEVVAELPRLLPDAATRGATDAKTRRDRLQTLSVELFRPQTDGGNVIYFDRPKEYMARAQRIVSLLKEAGRLDEFIRFIGAGEEDDEWKDFIGRGLRAFVGLAGEPRDTAAAEALAAYLIGREDASEAEAQGWRVPFQQGFVEALASEKELLPIAAKLATDLLPRLDERRTQLRDRLALLDVQGRALHAAGEKEKARELFEKLARLDDPQYARYRGMQGNSWYHWQQFQAKQPFFEKMLDDGVTDLPIEALFRTMSKFGENESWMVQQAEQLLTKWLAKPTVREALAGEIERMEKKHAEKPDDMSVVNHLSALYRAAGQPEKVEALVTQMSSGESVSGQKAVMIADQLYRAGKRDEARAMILKQLADGFTEPQMLQNHTGWFNNPAAAERLVGVLEKLPREARFIRSGDWWIENLSNSFSWMYVDRTAAEELAMRALGVRIRIVADEFSRATQNQHGDTRSRLGGLVISLIGLGRDAEAYERLTRAIFASRDEGLPELTLGALFSESGQTRGGRGVRLARLLASLAIRLGKVDDLRAKIDARRKSDPVWEDTALRLTAALELEQGNREAAAEIIREIAKRPPPPAFEGADLSLAALAGDVSDRPEMQPLCIELLEKVVEQLRGRSDGDWQSMQYGFQLARLYMEAGQVDKARQAFDDLREYIPDYMRMQGQDFHRSMGGSIAAVWLAGGYVEEAAKALRKVLTAPIGGMNYYIPTFESAVRRPPEAALGELSGLIERLDRESKLDAMIAEAKQEWEAVREKPAGRRDCEPLIFVAACQLRRGDVAGAEETLKALEPADYPPSLPLLVECAAAGGAAEKCVPLLGRLFERWPYLFAKVGWQLAHLHLKAGAPLAVGADFDAYLATLPPPKAEESNPFGTMVYRSSSGSGGGNDPTLPPPPEKQVELLREGLQRIVTTFLEEQRVDEPTTRLAETLVRRLGDKSAATYWLRGLSMQDPVKAYEAAVELLGLRDGTDVDSKAVRLGLNELFAPVQPPSQRAAKRKADPLVHPYPETFAAQIFAAVEEAGKLAEFTQLLEAAIARGQAGGASGREIGRKEMATRLQLGALAAQDEAAFKERLPKFLKAEDVYARRASDRQEADPIDPALQFVAAAAWKNTALRPQAIEVLRYAEAESKRQREAQKGSGNRYYAGTNAGGSQAARLVEALLATGDKAGACAALREAWKESIESIEDASPYTGGWRGLAIRPDSLPQLARRYNAASELLALVREMRPALAGRPMTDRACEGAERALRVMCGETVEPGIVLAAQALDENRLALVWQVNRLTLPVPPEALVPPELAKIEAPVCYNLTVDFASGEDVVTATGRNVRLESSPDGISWEAIRTIAATGDAPRPDGFAVTEITAPMGELRWYRAVLLEGEKVAATSSSIAAVAAPNALEGAETLWTPTRWSAGTMDRIRVGLPHRGGAELLRATSEKSLRLESKTSIPVRSDRKYVLSGWAARSVVAGAPDGEKTSGPGENDDPNTPAAADEAVAERVWVNANLIFSGSKGDELGQQRLALGTRTVAFSQVVMLPPDDRLETEQQRWIDRVMGRWQSGSLPRRAATVRLTLEAGRNAAFGELYLSATGAAARTVEVTAGDAK